MAEWRVIPEHPQYWVSDEGEVAKQFATRPPLLMTPYYKPNNKQWGVAIQVEYKHKFLQLNRLVWRIFNGNPVPDAIEHIDGNKANNAILNLREGKLGAKLVLTPQQIHYIRYTTHKPQQVVADELHIGKSTLANYRRRIRKGEL